MLRRVLYWIGYAIAPVLFLGASTPAAVAARLRLAYRLVGVRITHATRAEDTERTIFRCPYRRLGADRYGEKRLCHDVLDRVDDGYVSYLWRHKDIEYRRPRDCAAGDACEDPRACYSEVLGRG